MKQYTHAWLAFKAVERLERKGPSKKNRQYSKSLVKWFKDHKDGVIQGAWYPDSVIKDMASSHVLKFTPSDTGSDEFRCLPTSCLMYAHGKESDLYRKPYVIDKDDNLPDRCGSISHSVIDNLKMQEMEPKGSPISPTDNHVATLLFMLSHYVADAHMPFHCDSRRFSEKPDLHGHLEKQWDKEMRAHFAIDEANERFIYNPDGYPLLKPDTGYDSSFLKEVDDDIRRRDFMMTWGTNNNNVWDFMSAICQYSYLLSYAFVPQGYDETNVNLNNWQQLNNQRFTFEELSFVVLSDAVDSIARVWLRVWRRYVRWEKKQRE